MPPRKTSKTKQTARRAPARAKKTKHVVASGTATPPMEAVKIKLPNKELRNDLDFLLSLAVPLGASDLHVTCVSEPRYRVLGELWPLSAFRTRLTGVTQKDLKAFTEQSSCGITISSLRSILSEQQRHELDNEGDISLAYETPDGTRFRVNVYQDVEGLAGAFRYVPKEIKSPDELNLSQAVRNLSRKRHGLVLVTGVTGMGKSTTIASILEEINQTEPLHIVTLERPIEYLHTSQAALFNQREIGSHAKSLERAIAAVLVEDPDILLVEDMRSRETVEFALNLASAGRLVFASMHASNVVQAIDRIFSFFPGEEQPRIRNILGDSLSALVAQRLVRSEDRTARYPLTEILTNTRAVANLIRSQKSTQLATAVQTGRKEGMETFAQSLAELEQQGKHVLIADIEGIV